MQALCDTYLQATQLEQQGSFFSLENLRERLVAFIEYFNHVLARPFKWTYTGRPLQA